MIISKEKQIGIQRKDLRYTYLSWEDGYLYSYFQVWYEPLTGEKGNTQIAPSVLVEWS